jgi:hypothetical protein
MGGDALVRQFAKVRVEFAGQELPAVVVLPDERRGLGGLGGRIEGPCGEFG